MDEDTKEKITGWLIGAWIVTGVLYQGTDNPVFLGMCVMSLVAALYVVFVYDSNKDRS